MWWGGNRDKSPGLLPRSGKLLSFATSSQPWPPNQRGHSPPSAAASVVLSHLALSVWAERSSTRSSKTGCQGPSREGLREEGKNAAHLYRAAVWICGLSYPHPHEMTSSSLDAFRSAELGAGWPPTSSQILVPWVSRKAKLPTTKVTAATAIG